MEMNDLVVHTLLDGVLTTGVGEGAVRCAYPGAQIHVWSAAGSSCTVLIQGSHDNTNWKTLATITNPAAAPAGECWEGTGMPYLRANVSAHASGTVYATMVGLSKDPGRWNLITRATETATAIAAVSLTASSLTAGRVPICSTAGLLADDATLLFDASTKQLSATVLKGGLRNTVNAYAVDGAVSVAPQTALLTKAGTGAYTLAAPTSTTHDGYRITLISTTAQAHVVTFASGKINGGSNITATFGGAIGDSIVLEAYQGVWYTVGEPRNVTVAS